MGDTGAVVKLARKLRAKQRPMELLVNNACGWFPGGISGIPSQVLEAQVTASVTGTMLLVRELLPSLALGRAGSIVNICSTVGTGYRFSTNTLYVTLKGALDAFGRCLRNDVRSRGIRVTNLHLGRLKESESPEGIPVRDVVRAMDLVVEASKVTCVDSVVLTPLGLEY